MLRKIPFRTFGSRIFLIFLFSFIGISIILSFIYYQVTSKQLEDTISDAGMKNVKQASEHIDLLLQGYESLSKSIITNTDIQNLVGKHSKNSAVKAINDRTITNAIGAIYYAWDDVISIHVLSNDGAAYSYGALTQVVNPDYMTLDWYKQLQHSEGETVWFGMETDSLIDTSRDGEVFAFGRKLYNLTRTESVGVVIIEMRTDILQNILQNSNITEYTETYLVEQGIIKGGRDSQLFQQVAVELEPLSSAGKMKRVDDHFIVRYPQKINDWELVSLTESSIIKVEIVQFRQYFMIITIALVILSMILAILISVHVTSPFKKLRIYMRKVTLGNFEEIPIMKSYVELESLTGAYNQMVRKLDELFVQMREMTESERIAQIQALQSQINPHFLYNTLDMIYWMLDEHENEKLGDIVLALSSMFRYSSNWKYHSDVTLREELEQIKAYALITQMRFGKKLVFDWKIDPDVLDVCIPKMSLQPIVENAVIHGVSEGGGKIEIAAYLLDSVVRISITDHGKGMDQVTLDRLNTLFTQAEVKDDLSDNSSLKVGIGLVNVHKRIVYRYGLKYGLSIASSGLNRGSTVNFALPYQSTQHTMMRLE
ncbi:MAG: histidine kinase [Candidatus Pristimantibacillus lignocellulolyticus]|uniref:Histidine kinase n=1 Tax=Candidatus Pristimantibacillus lignocellulolyticus TaxID=2994561 RepID=A0A9J6ZG00_9BACL|nr:MAG: histidine kinase [Candidatus Pristimantibacillus lignocellulolyticus]